MPSHVIYARKSTESDDRQILSIDSQVHELKALALRRGFEVDEVLTEARSAKAPGRPVFSGLMKRIGRGEIGSVLCWKMDRLARNHLDTGHVLQALADGMLAGVITPEREYTADGNDRFLGSFELGMATKFIDDLRVNVKRGNRARYHQGWPTWRPPIGYLEDHTGPTTVIVQDPERFPLVRQMWDHLLSGRMNPMQIARWADSEGLRTRKTARQGGKPLCFQAVFRLFANPFYMGLIRLRSGESYKGSHEPMLTPAEFEDAQVILGLPGRSPVTRHAFAYAGLLRCSLCGKTLVPEEHIKSSGRRFVYYRCRGRTDGKPCTNPCLPETALERQLEADLARVTLPAAAVSWIVDNIRNTLAASLVAQATGHQALTDALAESQRESETLLTLRLRGQVDDTTFERRRVCLLDQQVRLQLQLNQPAPSPAMMLGRLQRVLDFSASLPWAFRDGDPVRRREIVLAICANPTVRDRKALYTAKEPWSFFADAASTRSWLGIVESVRTWLVRMDFQIPQIFAEVDPIEEKYRRTGTLAR